MKNFTGDRWLFILPLVLSLIGLIMIFDASSVSAVRDFGDHFHYIKLQSIWFLLGAVLFLVFSQIDYRRYKKFAVILFFINLVFLLLVLIPGIGKEVLGGRRWLNLGFIGFQPGELVKLTLVIYLATLFEKKRHFWPFLVTVGVLLGLLILQPDLGTAVIVVATAVGLYFAAGAPIRHFITISLVFSVVGPLLIMTSPYRKERLMTFFNPGDDIQGASYHLRQILLALGSGGFWGRGWGQGRQKYLFLPEVTTDSIFAVIGEELGFLGAGLLIFLYLFLIYRGLFTVSRVSDPFGRILGTGIIFFIGFQALINLSAMVSLVPLTGVPLPFISYGGSFLVICLSGMGILYNISKSAIKGKR